MRVAFIGVSHWHTPFYIEPAAALDDCTILGVSDPSKTVAEDTAGRFSTRGFESRPEAGRRGGTLNLSIHFYDLVRVLAPDVDWRVVAASMSRSYGEADVEDFSATLVEGAAAGRPSKPYFYPGPGGEVGLSVNVGGDCYRWSGAQRQIFLTRADGSRETFETESDQVASYALFVEDTLRRIQDGEAPLAGLAEMAQAARMAEAAYRLAGYDDFMI